MEIDNKSSGDWLELVEDGEYGLGLLASAIKGSQLAMKSRSLTHRVVTYSPLKRLSVATFTDGNVSAAKAAPSIVSSARPPIDSTALAANDVSATIWATETDGDGLNFLGMPMPMIRMATNEVTPPHGFWSTVRDVVRCNRKDGKRWQCSREVVPGQKYCERHVGRGRNRPKRSTEAYSATSDVPATPSLGAISSVSMAAAAAQGVLSGAAYNKLQLLSPLTSDRSNLWPSDSSHALGPSASSSQVSRELTVRAATLPSRFDKVARVKILYDRVRYNFPFFDPSAGKENPVFMENAGGSQCPQVVIDAISNYMKTSYVQLGAGYEISNRATETVKVAHDQMKTFTNAHGFGEVVFGPSSSQLMMNLTDCYSYVLKEGDEVIIHEANHEANVTPWLRMAARCGASIKWWRINYETFESDLDDLAHLLSPRTRIVAVPHVSNILGEILDVGKIVKVVKSRIYEHSVRVVADGVAYAPHRAVDVAKWGIDWYVFSSYKVYGPHMAVLFGTHDSFTDIQDDSPNWSLLATDDVTKKFELGGVCHEACAGVVALTQYLGALARIGEAAYSLSSEGGKNGLQHAPGNGMVAQVENGASGLFDSTCKAEDATNMSSPVPEGTLKSPGGVSLDLQAVPETFMEAMTSSTLSDWEDALQGTKFGQEALGFGDTVSTRPDRVIVEAAYDTIKLLEQPLQEKLLAFLRSRNDVIILGPKASGAEFRVPTVSFIHTSRNSVDISRALQTAGFAVRHGNMYSFRLLSGLASHKKLTVNSADDGVVRISMVHYNTPIEVARLIACLQAIL
ncbi:unnamed protein product [Calypogeia fissa]